MYSMTGFGKGEAKGEKYNLSVEVKTVNHRFKDLRFKMSSLFNSKEIELRKKIESKFKRGSFDIYVQYKKNQEIQSFDDLDKEKIEDYIDFVKNIAEKKNIPLEIRPGEFLRSEFYSNENEEKQTALYPLLTEAIDKALDDLLSSREKEGTAMISVLTNHLNEYESLFKTIEAKADDFEKGIREKILKKFEEYEEVISQDDTRFRQEIIYYLEKVDIHEEINRIHTHLDKLKNLLGNKKEVGRQIDFTIQELNRETNTIGSKSSVTEISEAVIQMKAQLEKIREQALNLE